MCLCICISIYIYLFICMHGSHMIRLYEVNVSYCNVSYRRIHGKMKKYCEVRLKNTS